MTRNENPSPELGSSKKARLLALALVLAVGLWLSLAVMPRALAGDRTEGAWKGAIELPGGATLEVLVRLETGGEGWKGSIDIPAQGAKGLALADIRYENGRARFTISGVPGTPTFDGAVDGDEMAGTFTQGAASLPFRLSRDSGAASDDGPTPTSTPNSDEIAGPLRPQEPKPPFPYGSEEVRYRGGAVTLAGTLTIPGGAGPFPAVVLLSGSGPQDRDSSLFGHKPFLLLADTLTRAGIAVLRSDDRGVGDSEGSLSEVTIEDLAGDALAAVNFLKADRRIDGGKIGLLGHSEGGMVAPLAGSRSEDVAFLALLAAPAVPMDELLLRQNELLLRAAGKSEDEVAAFLPLMARTFEAVGADEATLRRLMEPMVRRQLELGGIEAGDEMVAAAVVKGMAQLGSRWLRQALRHEPAEPLRGLSVPVLALYGGLDLQVDAEQNGPAMEAALKRAGVRASVQTLPGLNHLLQEAKTGRIDEYGAIEETMAPRALEAIREWLRETALKAPQRGASAVE